MFIPASGRDQSRQGPPGQKLGQLIPPHQAKLVQHVSCQNQDEEDLALPLPQGGHFKGLEVVQYPLLDIIDVQNQLRRKKQG